jgi:hypothetical protein
MAQKSLQASVGSELQLSSPEGRVIQKLAISGASKRRLSALKAAGGQIALSSPYGRWLQRACVNEDKGTYSGQQSRTLLKAAGGELQLSSPVGQFSLRLK